jgi:hypothetical protein
MTEEWYPSRKRGNPVNGTRALMSTSKEHMQQQGQALIKGNLPVFFSHFTLPRCVVGGARTRCDQ